MRVMYHYTSQAGLAAILQSKALLPSLRANNPKDARYGDGQYISDIVPGTKRPGQLSLIFFGIPFGWRRFTHYVTINVDGLTVTYGRPNVFVIKSSGPLDISKRLIGSGQL
jgi:hypothetical protein